MKNILAFAFILFLISCEQEHNAYNDCRISSIEEDAFAYFFNYSLNGKLTDIETNSNISYKWDYSNDSLSKIKTVVGSTPVQGGTIQFLNKKVNIVEINTTSSKTYLTFGPESGLVRNILFKMAFANSNANTHTENKTIHYLEQNVIAIEDSVSEYSRYVKRIIYKNIKYDNKLNPYRMLANSTGNFKVYMNMADYSNVYSPKYLSLNNPISYEIVTEYNGGTYSEEFTFDYKYNELNYPTEVLVKKNGEFNRFIKYSYSNCSL